MYTNFSGFRKKISNLQLISLQSGAVGLCLGFPQKQQFAPRHRDPENCEGSPGSRRRAPGRGKEQWGPPRWPRNRLTLLAAAFDPGIGMGEDAGSAVAPAGAALGVPSRSDRPHLRASDRAGVPPARKAASCSHDRLPCPKARADRFQELGTPPPAARPAPGAGTKPGERPGPAPPARDRIRTRSHSPQPRRLRSATPATEARGRWRGPAPPSRRDPTRARAHLILDFGRKPVGRALIEVGHGDRLWEEAALGSGVLPLGFPAPSPEEWPQRQRLESRSPGRRTSAGGASEARSD